MSDAIDPIEIVRTYNGCINSRDLDKLALLMDEAHTFVDTAGTRVKGKTAGKETWRGFFKQFPDYRNVFEKLEKRDDSVIIVGKSVCSFEPLNGPALWKVKTRNGKVLEWRVFDDTVKNRRSLGIR
jgi:ketosteroid isomerase-like protein